MLVLSRKTDEKIIIGGGLIEVQVVEIRGDVVRLGIAAPREIVVHREEVHRAILASQAESEMEELIEQIPADLVWSRTK